MNDTDNKPTEDLPSENTAPSATPEMPAPVSAEQPIAESAEATPMPAADQAPITEVAPTALGPDTA